MSPSDAFKKPFRYDEDGQFIVDAENIVVLMVRGWGKLTGKGHGGLGLPPNVAEDTQKRFGSRVAELLNENM
jgi:hypothetical protein